MRKIAYKLLMLPLVNTIGSSLYKSLRKSGVINSDFVFPYKGVVQVSMGTHQFKMFSDGNDTIASRIFQDGPSAFEPEMEAIFRKLIQRSKTFFDIGANTGFYGLLASSLNKECEVHSFEPVPSIFDTLKTNIELNQANKIYAHKIALSNATKTSSFFVPNSIRIPTGASEVAQFQNCIEIPCQLKKLDDFVAENSISSIDLMKIDTETTEPMVLEGSLESISRFRPIIIIEILNDKVGSQVENQIAHLNYSFFQIIPGQLYPLSNLTLGKSRGKNWNFLLVPIEKRDIVT